MTKKYGFKDDFEMLCLRHDYLKRIPNVDQIDISRFEGISATTAKLMYDKFQTNFSKVGFEREDVISITRVYLVAFLGLYSIKVNQDALDRFVAKYKVKNGDDTYPTEAEFNRKDRNNLINFLRQRLYHCSNLCERKARNIIIGKDYRGAFAKTEKSTPACHEELIENHKKHGWRKVTKKELKESKIIAKETGFPELFDKDGFPIVEVEMLTQSTWNIEAFNPDRDYDGHMLIPSSNYSKIYGENDNMYSTNPEDTCIKAEDTFDIKSFKKQFFKLKNEERVKKLQYFIRKHGNEKSYKEEIKLAKKYLGWFKEKCGSINRHE